MHHAQFRHWLGVGVLLWLCCLIEPQVRAGGSGLNVVVIANQASSNSCALANYLCERRAVPPQNQLRITWTGSTSTWTTNDFQAALFSPLLEMLASRQLTQQVAYVVLSMDIPFETVNTNDGTINSTTSALFYGLKSGGAGAVNSYAASETAFSGPQFAGAPGAAFLTTMITGDSLAQAEQVVDQGVASDSTFPQQPVVLAKSSDPLRNIRYTEFDNAAFNVAISGAAAILRTNTDALWAVTNCLGYETGLAQFAVPRHMFVPGAMADSLTSYGGDLFDPANPQTNLLAFLAAGAAGSYGTVSEPGQDSQKFPNAQVYFYQARGFSLAESYYQSIAVPYLGLVVGEPLAAPFAQAASGRWSGVLSNDVLSGTAPLSVLFFSRDAAHALSQIDLFVDGTYYSTLTNVGPCPGDVLTLTLNNYPLSYTVPTNATLGSMASDLAALINSSSNSAATRVIAFAHGDRVELQSVASNYFASPFYFTGSQISTDAVCRALYATWPLPPVVTGEGWDPGGAFRLNLNVPIPLSYTVQASSDLVHWTPIYTNSTGSSMEFLDAAAGQFPQRFYRLAGTVPYDRPQLSSPSGGGGKPFQVHIECPTLLPYIIQTSSDLQTWTPAYTNSAGGAMDFIDTQPGAPAVRFYRVLVLSQIPGAPVCSVANYTAPGGTLYRVDGAQAPYAVEVSTNSGQWTYVFTNLSPGGIQTTANSASGTGSVLSTFLTASRPGLTNIDVQGYYLFTLLGSPAAGGWLQFNITKTNGAAVSVAVTNSASLTMAAFAAQFCAAINTNPALQGADGVAAEDFMVSGAGTPTFNLRARSPGLQAAGLSVMVKRSGVSILPSNTLSLTNNLGDLRPRNHLFVSAGATRLGAAFNLDTTALADGFHELTAVAYEGSSVRTQSKTTLPVQIANSALSATLTLLDLTNSAPVGPSYHLQVVANTNTVSAIRLYSTGGLLGSVTNQAAAMFAFDSAFLGAGLHPFYAVVDTSDGRQYRTAKQYVRLVYGP